MQLLNAVVCNFELEIVVYMELEIMDL